VGKEESKYLGRKVLLNTAILGCTMLLAMQGKMTADVALVFTGIVASFNYALRNSG